MAISIEKKQNYIFTFLVCMTVVVSASLYVYFKDEWMLFRDAETLYKKKEYSSAIPFYAKSIDDGVDNPLAKLHLADSYVAVKRFEDAIFWYKKYLEVHPNDKKASLSLARALSWNKNIQESELEYKKILENSKEHDHEK